MKLRFYSGGPALIVRNRMKVLVIADLHFGIESDLARLGWHFPSRSAERLERVCVCVRDTDPDLLVLLGDVKHTIPGTARQEFFEIPGVFSSLRDLAPIRVVPGNHDGGIRRFLQEGELLPKEGAVIDGTGYIHGHTRPAPALSGRLIIAGHHHPMVSLYDEVGCSLRAPAYLLAELEKKKMMPGTGRRNQRKTRVLFMPAFNECAGFDIIRIIRHPFSPLSRSICADKAEVFLTDGTCVGPVSGLVDDVTA